MNIFRHELLRSRRSIFIWSLSLSLIAILFLSMYPAFTKDVTASQKVLENLPLAVRSALGISLANFFTVLGFFSYLLTFVSVAGAIQAINLGVGIVATETSGKTADFLLTKPVYRSKIITQKLLAATCAALITSTAFVVTAIAMAVIVSPDNFDAAPFILIASTLFLVQIAFLALGLFLSVILPRIKSIIAVSLPTIFGFFIVGSIGSAVGSDIARYFTPFKYYDPSYIIQHGSYDIVFLAVELATTTALVVSAYVLFNRKDIRSVS